MNSIRRVLVAGAVIGVALAATACSSTLSGHGSPALGAAGTGGASRTPTGFPSSAAANGSNAALSPAVLERNSKQAWESATSWLMKGSSSDGTSSIVLDVHFGARSSDGTATINGATVRLRYVKPDLYMFGGADFWRNAGSISGSPSAVGAAAVKLLSNRWVHIPAGTAGILDLSSLVVRTQFVAQAASAPDNATYSRGPSKVVDGIAAVSFVDNTDGSTIYVPASGTPYPIRIEDHGANAGILDLSDWNVPFSAPHPPAAQTIELPH